MIVAETLCGGEIKMLLSTIIVATVIIFSIAILENH
jgi:hypothetical protein